MGGREPCGQPGADGGGQPPQLRGRSWAGGRGRVHHEAAAAGCGQAAGVPGAVRERVSLSEVRVCAGAVAGVCGAAGEVLQGMQGTLREYGAVYGEGGGGVGLPSGVGSLCALFAMVRGWLSLVR